MTYTVYMWDYRTQRKFTVQKGLTRKVAEKCTDGLNYYGPMHVQFWYRKAG